MFSRKKILIFLLTIFISSSICSCNGKNTPEKEQELAVSSVVQNGKVRDDKNSWQESSGHWAEVVKMKPDDTYSRYKYALSLYRIEDFKQAKKQCQILVTTENPYKKVAKVMLKDIEGKGG
jgi:hypothetical protein